MGEESNHNCATVGDAVTVPTEANGKLTASPTEPIRHIYVHIPFCARICPYCAFYKELLDRSRSQAFCQALLRELRQHGQDPPAFAWPAAGRHLLPSTIYFGGGTPSALRTSQLEFLLRGFRESLDLSGLREWTLEANPGSVSARKAALLRELGINRISLGVQSWDDALLKLLGREHDAGQAVDSYQTLRRAGFSNINIDLMFGLPGQTMAQWRSTLQQTLALRPEHISTYCLTYEEDTEFFRRHARGELRVDPDADAELLEMTMSILQEAGYVHYEISNYARPGFESLHNRAYWSGEDYLGIGPSAFSTQGMERWQNVCDYRTYAERVLCDQSPIASVEHLTAQMRRIERIALGLRTREGVPAELLAGQPGRINEVMALGLLHQSNGNFTLTDKGKSLADSVAEILA